MSSDNQLRGKYIDYIRRGVLFTKYHDKTNKAAKRFMFYEDNCLWWCKENTRVKSSKHSCTLMSISRVIPGKKDNPVFEVNKIAAAAEENCSFSLLFDGLGKSLTLSADSQQIRDEWLKAVQMVSIGKLDDEPVNQQRRATSPVRSASPVRVAASSSSSSAAADPSGDAYSAQEMAVAMTVGSLVGSVEAIHRARQIEEQRLEQIKRVVLQQQQQLTQVSSAEKELNARLEAMTELNDELMSKNEELENAMGNQSKSALRNHEKVGELEALIKQYQDMESRHIEEWSALAASHSSGKAGRIEIVLAAVNLEHEAPHQYVAILHIRNPMEETYEFSQACSLMRSPDGSYIPRFSLSPTDLFAFSHESESDNNNNHGNGNNINNTGESHALAGIQRTLNGQQAFSTGKLVGAQLRIELWDLPSSSPDGPQVERAGYQGQVDFDMNQLITAKHHVLALPVLNPAHPEVEAELMNQRVKLVLQYCLPPSEKQANGSAVPASAAIDNKQKAVIPNFGSGEIQRSNFEDPAATLHLIQVEDELEKLQRDYAELKKSALIVQNVSNENEQLTHLRETLEQRLREEQNARMKAEAEAARLRPRAIELVEVLESLEKTNQENIKLKERVNELANELEKMRVPSTPQAMLDELVPLQAAAQQGGISLIDLQRIRRFILEQERIRGVLLEEMQQQQKIYLTYETAHDELVRREAALTLHVNELSNLKVKLEKENAILTATVHDLKNETLKLASRLEESESEREHVLVNHDYMQEQIKELSNLLMKQQAQLLVHDAYLDSNNIMNNTNPSTNNNTKPIAGQKI